MREIRQSGSEGGGGESNCLSLPLFQETRMLPACRLSERSPTFSDWRIAGRTSPVAL